MALRQIPRLSSQVSSRRGLSTFRPLLAARAPSLADVQPDKGHEFDTRQQRWRTEINEATARKEQADRKPIPMSIVGGHLTDMAIGDAAAVQDGTDKKSGRLSNLIYGTPEGRQLDKDIERSFSQVLARGKYVHSIVFHEVKPDKVDEYVELVGSWYPKVASMPENKVHLVGSWRTEVGDCDTFGEPIRYISFCFTN